MTINPYAGAGRLVVGERLVGREEQISTVLERTFALQGNISVVGMPRIGKTSLVLEAKRRYLSSASFEKPPVIYVNVGICNCSSQLLTDLIERILEAHEERVDLDRFHHLGDMRDDRERFRALGRVLRVIRKAGHQSIVILDEFDHIRGDGYKNTETLVQQLRDLLYQPHEYGLHAIFISRRTLAEIERQTQNSILAGICESVYLRPLSSVGLGEMIQRGNSIRSGFAGIEEIYALSGGHPYLSELALARCFDMFENSHAELDLQDVKIACFRHYDHLETILKEAGLFDQLIQLCVGPRWSLRPDSADKLSSYGIVRRVSHGERTAFMAWSQHYQEYLFMQARREGFWEAWRDTEGSLRDLIEYCVKATYGSNWIEVLSKRHENKLRTVFQNWERMQFKEQQNFGDSAAVRLLDYSYPMELWLIVSSEWPLFRSVFGQDKSYWQSRFEAIARVRNPSAHSREWVLPAAFITQAKGYCQEMLDVFRAFYAKPEVDEQAR